MGESPGMYTKINVFWLGLACSEESLLCAKNLQHGIGWAFWDCGKLMRLGSPNRINNFKSNLKTEFSIKSLQN